MQTIQEDFYLPDEYDNSINNYTLLRNGKKDGSQGLFTKQGI